MPDHSRTDHHQIILGARRPPPSRLCWAAALGAFAAAMAVYGSTAYPTIAWWSSAELALAAHELGVMAPPGGVIPTLAGWVVLHVVPGEMGVFALNLFAGLLAAGVVAGAILLGCRLEWISHATASARGGAFAALAVMTAAGATGLALAFGETLWTYALHYSEYVVTPLFTVLIVAALVRWWEAAPKTGGYGWLAVATLLLGLDLSVHRTNALLLPALPFWVLLRHPRGLLSAGTWLAGIGGLAAGLAFHLVLIPMARAHPFLNLGDPQSLDRWWSYVSLEMRGGGFLVNLYPRNADFWSVQVSDWVTAFTRTFASADGPLGVVGFVPLGLGVYGLAVILRRSFRLGLGLTLLFAAASLGAIVYFNIPAGYFRSLHRHYLPSLVIFGGLAVAGAAALVRAALRLEGLPGRLVAALTAACILLAAGNGLWRNYGQLDASADQFAWEYASNLLAPLPPDAILLTQGDNDTFPLWYLQRVEGVRPDVTVLNVPLLNTPWYVEQVRRWDPRLPLEFSAAELAAYAPVVWRDSTVAAPAGGTAADYELPESASVPDTVRLLVRPTAGPHLLLAQDQAVLRIIQGNTGRRPLYAVSGLGQQALPWLGPYLRLEGLVQRFVPVEHPALDPTLLARNLFEAYSYEGFAHVPPTVEPAAGDYLQQLGSAYVILFGAYASGGDAAGMERVCAQVFTRLNLDRLLPGAPFLQALEEPCRGLRPPAADGQ
ncbi:MAG TPA: DUF2723 domain-containing protein [candidate division Zixibacteria bacterium]|nr:DUF2723 domain-containing protein [candidate division Zixibacteria bacterium]MDD4918756.1 DUF2723 domain-containing protein [candidate division Zixibacteria bacterium]MDM7974285.1 DUF2723 domain-containing protein [candidate division Zixibacteria bacterium]HOD67433.1 DUF2723 domain-containing protein [candidate division Zixibacteria bacterium]HPM37025.1 DUF2723 domain-containing protein [candidate division Zixibacteria bacterium]